MLCLGLGIPIALVFTAVTSWQWLAYGAAAWSVAVAIKAACYPPIKQALGRFGYRLQATAAGLWSALCELGAVVVVLLRQETYPTLADVIGLGIGAGSIEVLLITWVGWRSLSWYAVLERLLACIGHLSTRGLVWCGLCAWQMAPAWLLAVVTFSLVDGTASYGDLVGWDWSDQRLLMRYYRPNSDRSNHSRIRRSTFRTGCADGSGEESHSSG